MTLNLRTKLCKGKKCKINRAATSCFFYELPRHLHTIPFVALTYFTLPLATCTLLSIDHISITSIQRQESS